MNIRDRLKTETAAAKMANEREAEAERHRIELAKTEFEPIVLASRDLQIELKSDPAVRIDITNQSVDFCIGPNRRIGACRIEAGRYFVCEGSKAYYEVKQSVPFEYTYRFDSSEEVIDFLVKACAEYLAKKR